MKRIVICCDGTWNLPDATDNGIPTPTNVVKIAQAVRPISNDDIVQKMYYDPGVGTSGCWLSRKYCGLTGYGLSRNIVEAYQYLISEYEVGDELFLFGFSRGAFTVRSLAGLIRKCGILRSDKIDIVKVIARAFVLYRERSSATHPRGIEATLFRRTYAVSDITPIRFIGVWDTVGALGNPLRFGRIPGGRNKFHDTNLSSTVKSSYQALAIDEKRKQFQATLWHRQQHSQNQTLEQVWFAGVHSNVGGGYPCTGLSDIALDWMIGKASHCGLELDSIETQPDSLQQREESRRTFYRLIPRFYRPIAKLDPNKGPTNESLHPSVIQRYQVDTSYRPQNLEEFFVRFPLPA